MTHDVWARRRTASGWNIRWNEAFAQQAYAEGWWQGETCASALVRAASEEPDRIVLIDRDTRLSAQTLHDRASHLARWMLSRFPVGSVISFMLPNWHEAAVIYMATTLAGMVANPILPSLRDHDLRFILTDVGSRMIFIPHVFRGHDYVEMLGRFAKDIAVPPRIVIVRGHPDDDLSLDRLMREASSIALPELDADDVRMVMYTSGTTGRPKGVIHTHNSLNALIRQIGRHWLVDPGDRFLVPSPISHIGGAIYAFETPLMLGATAILMDQWNADEALHLLADQGCSHMAGATPFLRQLLAPARERNESLPELKVFICGGASVPPSLIRDASAQFDRAVVTRVYGSTEVPVCTVGVIDRSDVDHAAETDGRPGIATVVIADDGEIRVRGPQMMMGYVHREDETSAFDDDGYYRTGDQGRWVDGDHLVVTGRIKDLIIRNGENIAPKEIEDLLLGHPEIAEIAIVGVADPKTGERAVAVIVPRNGAAPDLPSITAFLDRSGVARFKYPEALVLRPALPKNDAGKVLKQVLRDMIAAVGDDRPKTGTAIASAGLAEA